MEEVINPYMEFVAILINVILVPLAVRALKPLWQGVPSAIKNLVPLFIGSVLMAGSGYLSSLIGFPVDLSGLEEVFLGATLGLGASVGFKIGETHGRAS